MAVDLTEGRVFSHENNINININKRNDRVIPWMSESEILEAQKDLEAFRKQADVFVKMLPVPKHPNDDYEQLTKYIDTSSTWRFNGNLGSATTTTSSTYTASYSLASNYVTISDNGTSNVTYSYNIVSNWGTSIYYDRITDDGDEFDAISNVYLNDGQDHSIYITSSSGKMWYMTNSVVSEDLNLWGNPKTPDFFDIPMKDLNKYYHQYSESKCLPWSTDNDEYYEYDDPVVGPDDEIENRYTRTKQQRAICWCDMDAATINMCLYNKVLYDRWKKCPWYSLEKDYLWWMMEESMSLGENYRNPAYRRDGQHRRLSTVEDCNRAISETLFEKMHGTSDSWDTQLTFGWIDKEDLEESVMVTMSNEEETNNVWTNEITKRVTHVLPWMKNMLRDQHASQIASKERIDEWFTAHWYECENPYFRDLFFLGGSIYDKRQQLYLPDNSG